MKETTNSTNQSPEQPKHQEIKNFEISISNGQYWIDYEDRNYPVILTPHEFKRLFEVEGVPIEKFTDEDPVRFHKAVLLRSERRFRGDLFDEEGCDVTPQPCWVMAASNEKPIIP